MEQLRIDHMPELRDPALFIAFAGWSDAGQAATGATKHLVGAWSAERFGDVDPEEFFDFTEARPHVRLIDGMMRTLEWPANEFHFARGRGERDFVIWTGIEPHLRWRLFADAVMELISTCGISLVVTLGGLLVDRPHTREVRVTGTASDELLLARMRGVVNTGSRYEGPTGILGVLGDRFRRLGMPTASFWANVPHYINAAANPKATAAILERLDSVFDLGLDLRELREAGAVFEREVTEAVSGDADAAAYVRQLEEQADAEEAREEPPSLPSGESLVRELEEFFRRSRSDEEEEEAE